jgi:hypothetical protein
MVGGTNAGDGNFFDGGVEIVASGYVVLQGNTLGLGNPADGISIDSSSSDITIGGTDPGAGNTIADNAQAGIRSDGTAVSIVANTIDSSNGTGVIVEAGDASFSQNQIDTLLVSGGAASFSSTSSGGAATVSSGSLTLQEAALLSLTRGYTESGGSTELGQGSQLAAAGNFTQTGGSTTLDGSATLQVGGTLSLSAGTLTATPTSTTLNLGAYLQSGGAMQAEFSPLLVAGDFHLTGGTAFLLYGGGTISGALVVDGGSLDLYNVQPLTITGGMQINSGGAVELDHGTLLGNVSNAGTLSLGTSSDAGARYTISGNFTQTAAGLLVMHLSPWNYDQLSVGGTASLAGTFELVAVEGADPGPGSTFPVLVASSHSGTFATLGLPPLSNGVWYPDYSGGLTLDVVSS